MSGTVENLVLDLLEWVARKERTYTETMEAWRTSCPRLPIWEDASDTGLVEIVSSDGRLIVRLTGKGMDMLNGERPLSRKDKTE
jgi:D-3-phosphoglycerate dehydrogenase